MLFWCDLKFEKGEKKVCQKADSNPGWSRQNKYYTRFTICPTRTDDSWPSFVIWLAQSHVGGWS